MRRQRGPAHVTLPRIELDEPRQFRLSLRGRLCADLDEYRAAYREAYGVDVELEALIPHILETYIAADRSFKAWRTGRGGSVGGGATG
jgi:hypothetical protein